MNKNELTRSKLGHLRFTKGSDFKLHRYEACALGRNLGDADPGDPSIKNHNEILVEGAGNIALGLTFAGLFAATLTEVAQPNLPIVDLLHTAGGDPMIRLYMVATIATAIGSAIGLAVKLPQGIDLVQLGVLLENKGATRFDYFKVRESKI